MKTLKEIMDEYTVFAFVYNAGGFQKTAIQLGISGRTVRNTINRLRESKEYEKMLMKFKDQRITTEDNFVKMLATNEERLFYKDNFRPGMKFQVGRRD